MQETQKLRIEGLDSHAYPIDSHGAQSGYVLRGNVIRVTLDGKFFKIVETDGAGYLTEDLRYLIWRETRWSSAAEIYGSDGGSLKVITAQFQFTAYGLNITCGFFLTQSREEAAVYTTTGAERNMYVNARQGSDHGVYDIHYILAYGIGSLHRGCLGIDTDDGFGV